MEPRCPRCGATAHEPLDRGGDALRCRACGEAFPRGHALVQVHEAEELAAARAACTCDERRGCPQCFRRAEAMIGRMVRDAFGREWMVVAVGEKDHFPTIQGEVHWDLPDQVVVIDDG